jgi:hypothetical protein
MSSDTSLSALVGCDRSARGERRHRIHGQPHRGCRSSQCGTGWRPGCRGRRPGGRRDVDGSGRICFREPQSDTEKADLRREQRELERSPEWELRELEQIYETRGLDPGSPSVSRCNSPRRESRGPPGRVGLLRFAPPDLSRLRSLRPRRSRWAPPCLRGRERIDHADDHSMVSATSLIFLAVLGAVAGPDWRRRYGARRAAVTFWERSRWR